MINIELGQGRKHASNSIHGAKHSPPGDKFQKAGGPRATGEQPSKIQISKVKLYPNEDLSTSTMMMFDVDSKFAHPRF